MAAALRHFLYQTQTRCPSIRTLFRNIFSIETRACYLKYHQLPFRQNHLQSRLMLPENLEASCLILRRQCYFSNFCYQSLTLDHNLSLLRLFNHFSLEYLFSQWRSAPAFQWESKQRFLSFLLFSNLSACLHAQRWNILSWHTIYLSELATFYFYMCSYLLANTIDCALLISLVTGSNKCTLVLLASCCFW